MGHPVYICLKKNRETSWSIAGINALLYNFLAANQSSSFRIKENEINERDGIRVYNTCTHLNYATWTLNSRKDAK